MDTVRSRQKCYDSLLGSGVINPPHWADLTLQLVLEHAGESAWRRSCRLIDTALSIPGLHEELPDLAEFCIFQENDAVSVDPVVMDAVHPMYEPLLLALEEIIPFARTAPQDEEKGQSGPGAPSDDGYWRQSQKSGKWYFVKKDMKGVQAAAVTERAAPAEKSTASQKIGKASEDGKQPKDKKLGPEEVARRKQKDADKMARQQQAANDAMAKKLARGDRVSPASKQQAAQSGHMQNIIATARSMIAETAKKVRDMGANAWKKLSKDPKSDEMRALAKQVGVRPSRLEGLSGKTLEAIANPARTPANPHTPLSARGKVPDLEKIAKKVDPIPAKKPRTPDEANRPANPGKAPDGGFPHKGSPGSRQESQQATMPALASPRATGLVNKIGRISSYGQREQQAIAKAISSLSHGEALHVFRQVVKPADQGAMPVPRTSAEAAAGVVHALKNSEKRNDIGAVIAANQMGMNVARALVASGPGQRHAQLTRESNSLSKQAGEMTGKVERSLLSRLGLTSASTQVDELIEKKSANEKEMATIASSGRELLARSLESGGNSPKIDLIHATNLPGGQQTAIRDVAMWLHRSLRGADLKLKIHPTDEKRSYAQPGDHPHQPTDIFLSSGSRHKTIIHEIGHAIENQIPGAREAAAAFIKHRCGNEKPRNMGEVGGHDGEYGRKDSFDRHFPEKSAHYVGKTYPSGDTEVISMGLQEMYHDPVAFARNDPEYFSLIHGILSGSTRMSR